MTTAIAEAPPEGGTVTTTPDGVLPARAGHPARPALADHLAAHGPLGVPAVDRRGWAATVEQRVAEARLFGRGGGGFPAAAKWRALRGGSRPLVVVNAMEGEPAGDKDRTLLTCAPHLVLDGAEVLSVLLGADDVVVCVADDDDAAATALERALAERTEDNRERARPAEVRVSVRRPPRRYVSGEESALAAWLDGGAARPSLRLDKSRPLRVGRHPAVVHNAETVARLALLARPDRPGRRPGAAASTTLVTVSGAVASPGVYEVPIGSAMREVLDRAGAVGELSGILVGGYGGAWLPPDRLDTPYAPGPLRDAGATMGVGVVVALGAGSCGIAETARIVRYMAGESAGQCGPCVFGLPALAEDLAHLASGRPDADLLARLVRRADVVEGRGACRHPDGVVRLVRTALRVFEQDAAAHAAGRPCAGRSAPTVMRFGPGSDRVAP